MRIIVTSDRGHSRDGSTLYIAQLENRPEIFGQGASVVEAVGRLVFDHDLKLNLEVQVIS